MLSIHMPNQGYLEMTTEDLTERECTIVTNRGAVTMDYMV